MAKQRQTYRVDGRPDIADDVAVVAVSRGERVARPREDGQLVVVVGVGLQRVEVVDIVGGGQTGSFVGTLLG